MQRVARNGLIIVAAASGALGLAMPAYADSAADGAAAQSPGVISGNTIQLPVHVPVNVCGNTVNVVGLLNPAAGNSCTNESADRSDGYGEDGHEGSGAAADGSVVGSPGLISGNGVQLPVDLPVNVTGNSVNVVGIGNPAVGNESSNVSGERPQRPVVPPAPERTPPSKHPVKPAEPGQPEQPGGQETPRTPPQGTRVSLADTGSGPMGATVAGSAALMLGGALLFRRFRSAAVRRTGH